MAWLPWPELDVLRGNEVHQSVYHADDPDSYQYFSAVRMYITPLLENG